MKKIDKRVILRKLVHSFGALILLLVKVYGLLAAQLLIISLVGVYLSTEYLRLSGKTIPPFTWLVKKASTEEEQRSIVSTPLWYATGVFLTLSLFPLDNAAIGVLTLSIGDPIASLVGLSLTSGTPNPINIKKTIEGSLIGLFVSILFCLTIVNDLSQVLVGCSAGMFIEMLPTNFNDNLSIPITALFISWFFKMVF
jgi:dolichol kinase